MAYKSLSGKKPSSSSSSGRKRGKDFKKTKSHSKPKPKKVVKPSREVIQADLDRLDFSLDTFGKLEYVPGKASFVDEIRHYGQLKLCIGLMSLLNMVLDNKNDQVHLCYIGSAPGHYLGYVLSLFPQMQLTCYDPRPMKIEFAADSDAASRYVFNQQFFEDKDADVMRQRFSEDQNRGIKTLFVSDIRNNIMAETPEERAKSERMIIEDMKLQSKWAITVNADFSQFKFRVPYAFIDEYPEYSIKEIEYLPGKIERQVFPSPNSTELRLTVRQKDLSRTISYKTEDFDRFMAFHNKIVRGVIYPDKAYASLATSTMFDDIVPIWRFDRYHTCKTVSDYVRRMEKRHYNAKETKDRQNKILEDILRLTIAPSRLYENDED